ncbi:hypothetical protein ACI7RC_14330 [Brevibacillus sp. B_LB10_24]|uniref:hypothetical protein n=1 Tax=Brevibacillus sp. B_LB10_24 TaxID=3380645 RepID=UPI0038BB063A
MKSGISKRMRIVYLLIGLLSFVLIPAVVIGCSGSGTEKAADTSESQTKPAAAEKPEQKEQTVQNEQTEQKSEEPKGETPMNYVDMSKQIVITKESMEQGAQPPDAVPDDIPILDHAKNTTAMKIGDGKTPGDPYYQVNFQVSDSVEKTAELYRQILKDNGLDIAAEEKDNDVQVFKVYIRKTGILPY